MKVIKKLVVVYVLSPWLLTSLSATAATINSQSVQSDTAHSQEQSTSRGSAQQQAQVWGLSDSEWSRYEQVMKGRRGVQSPGLDPLTALGIETSDSSERRHLAELWVRQEYERTERELAFQREVNAAWNRLYPDTLAVNMGNAAGIAHDTNGRLALFVKENCARCDARLAAVLADNRPVDIYLVGSNDDDNAIRQWAVRHNVPVDRVRNRQITLNHDKGLWLRFGQGQMPVILQQGDNGWQVAAF